MNDEKEVVGTVIASHYNADIKAIRFCLKLDDDFELNMEWPITLFAFTPDMDKEEEMHKLAQIMRGKKIKVLQRKNENT